jgi:hypothetical protein
MGPAFGLVGGQWLVHRSVGSMSACNAKVCRERGARGLEVVLSIKWTQKENTWTPPLCFPHFFWPRE